MSRNQAVLDGRYVRWCNELAGYGYALEDPPRPAMLSNQFTIFARRPPEAGPPTTITISEQWVDGAADPLNLGVTREGCTLLMASWHAQVDDEGPEPSERALRLDLDPAKPEDLRLHSHPFGKANDVRVPLDHLPEPGDWVDEVESLIFDLSFDGIDELD